MSNSARHTPQDEGCFVRRSVRKSKISMLLVWDLCYVVIRTHRVLCMYNGGDAAVKGGGICMTMLELLEQDKSFLLTQLKEAGTPDKAEPILRKELDKLLAQKNEENQEERTRSAAARMVQTAELMLPLADSTGETRIWERADGSEEKEKERKIQVPGAVLLTLGLVLTAALLVLLGLETAGNDVLQASVQMPVYVLLALCAALFCFLGGVNLLSLPGEVKKEFMTEKRLDAEKIYRCLQAAMVWIEQNLKEEEAQARFEAQIAENAGEDGPLDEEEMALLAELTEGLYSQDGAYALEKLQSVKYYLHKRNVELAEYTEDTASWFDRLPGKRTFLLRPALVKDGQLIKKGLVCLAQEKDTP